jgi:Fic family protein
MSAYFDDHRNEYIDRLYRVSTEGDIKGWIEFCLRGVTEQSKDIYERCVKLIHLQREYVEKVRGVRGSYRLPLIVDELFRIPLVNIPYLASKFGVSYPTARTDVNRLIAAGILVEMPDAGRKTFICPQIMDLIYE